MDVGINYPWQSYGADFGYLPGWSRNRDKREWEAEGKNNKNLTVLDETLVLYATLGIKIVRWFILADGISYGFDEQQVEDKESKAPHEIKRKLSRFKDEPTGKWDFSPPGPLDEAFISDFEKLLWHFRQLNNTLKEPDRIKLLPCLVDFTCFKPGDPQPPADHGGRVFVKQGRYAMLNDDQKRSKFLQQTLRPLLNKSKEYRDVIYGWDLINEPEIVTQPASSTEAAGADQTVPLEKMRVFIQDGVQMINAANIDSTVGFQYYNTLQDADWNVSKLGIKKRQFHYYGKLDKKSNDNEDLPQNEINAFLGEIATNVGGCAVNERWPGLTRSDTVYERLRYAKEKGYQTVLLWSGLTNKSDIDAEAKGNNGCPRTNWSDDVQKQVLQFTREEQRRSH